MTCQSPHFFLNAMKKLILVLAVSLLSGCGKEETGIKKSDYKVYHEYWFDKTVYESGEAVAFVEASEFDFDILPPNIESSHKFKVENKGKNPLKLIVGAKTCKCTDINIIDREIAPGKSGEIELVWKTVAKAKQFLHSGSVYTNDPNNRSLKFVVKGRVSREMAMLPGSFEFKRVQPNSTENKSNVILFSEEWDFIKIKDISTTFEGDAKVDVHPLTERQMTKLKSSYTDVKSGVNLELTLKTPAKPGLINGVVSFKMVGPDNEVEHRIDVRGKVIRRLSLKETRAGVITPDSVLRLGRVDSVLGHREKFLLTVNDPDKKINLTSVKAVPEFVKVEMKPLNKNVEKHGVYVLEVVIPPGQKAVNHNRKGSFGSLKIEFDHERVAPFDLGLDFFVIK